MANLVDLEGSFDIENVLSAIGIDDVISGV
ncbi:hypothetical protein LCGC14_2797460, partial [marine sediment metagenome]